MKNSKQTKIDFRKELEQYRVKNLKEIKGGGDILIADLAGA